VADSTQETNMSAPAPSPGLPEPVAGAITIDVVSDVVCPWCYIGKKQLDAALAEMPPDRRPTVRWHPFQLNPEMPAEGIDRRSYLETKFGGAERAAQIYERVRQAGRTVGIEFEFDRIRRQPSTFDAHRLVAWAERQPDGDVDALVEALFRAYFIEGRSIGDRDVLAAVAAETGFDAAAARQMLDSDWGVFETSDREEQSKRIGVSGVPFFIFDRRLAVSGAQGADALRRALERVRATG
jgi:predicted DsbA family dithiol-disulfide isomerase